MPVLTLLTDFGLRDGFSAIMKGVILRILPGAQIIDISHSIHPQNIREGSLVWMRSQPYFPDGTVHIAVVDPGVGTSRRPIAARIGSAFFVCPDNGLITLILSTAEAQGQPVEFVHLDRPEYWLPDPSSSFHGRDIFAPVGAHLASGVPLSQLGTPIQDPQRLSLPQPEKLPNGWRGEVITSDHFGNLATNITPQHLSGLSSPVVRIAWKEIEGISNAFGERAPGELTALVNSDGFLEIAVVNGDAASRLGVEIGAQVEVTGGPQ